MNITTIIGVMIGALLLALAVIFSVSGVEFWRIEQPWGIFVNLPGLLIVVGGTAAATFISFHFPLIKRVFHSLNVVFRQEPNRLQTYIPNITRLAALARKNKLQLEKEARRIEDPFLKDGIQMLSDQFRIEEIMEILQQRIDLRVRKELEEAHIFRTMARFSPAFGMVGTLIGLIGMLSNMGSDDTIGRIGGDMAVALVTTFYGLILANLLFIPFANKLEQRAKENAEKMRMILESVRLIGESWQPRKVEDYLNSFVQPSDRVYTDLNGRLAGMEMYASSNRTYYD